MEQLSMDEGMEIVFNALVESAKKLGHTEQSIKVLLREEFHKKYPQLFFSDEQLNSLYRAYNTLAELYIRGAELHKEPTVEIKKMVIECLNDTEAIFNHFEIIRPLKIETLLTISLKNVKIKENINLLLNSDKVISNSSTYHKDGREQTKEWQNRSYGWCQRKPCTS